MNKSISYILILLGASLWGCMGMCNRFLTAAGFSQSQILFVRCIFTFAVLLIYVLLFNRSALRIKPAHIWCFLGSGLLSFTAFAWAYNNAMQEMSLSVAVVLLYTAPIWVVLLSAVFFKEKLNMRKIVALVLVVCGALFSCGVIGGALTLTPLGLLFGFISGLGYALYSIFSRFAFLRGYSSLTVTFYTFLFATIASAFIGSPTEIPALVTNASVVFWMLAISLGSTLLAYVLYTKGLEHVENGPASVIATIELVVATAISALFFGEAFSVQNALGVVFVIAGIVVMNVNISRRA